MSSVQTERVLVVPTEHFHQLGHFQGFCNEPQAYLDELFRPEQMSYRARAEVEEDPSFKQLIPYCILRYDDGESEPQLFQYTRGSGQGEGRLHAKRSIGIGGHISAEDDDADSQLHPYEEGMRRELDEEVSIDTTYESTCVGLINDDETEVGRVHLGVVHFLDVAQPLVQPREEDIANAGFRPLSSLLAEIEQFETWSQICLRSLFGEK